MADQPGEADRAAVHQRDAPAAAVDAEHGVLGGDPQVAPERQLEAAGDRVALDGGDHRLAQQHAGRADGAVAVGLHPAGPRSAGLLHRLEVGARAELPARPGRARRPRPSSSASKRRKASASASAVGRSTAFATSGRSIVTTATGPSVS